MHIIAMEQIDVKKIRQECELTQKGFADLLGVNISTVWRWENGTPPRGPARFLLSKLAKEAASKSPSKGEAA